MVRLEGWTGDRRGELGRGLVGEGEGEGVGGFLIAVAVCRGCRKLSDGSVVVFATMGSIKSAVGGFVSMILARGPF